MVTNLFLSVVEISLSTGLIVLALIIAAPLLNKRYAAKWKYWIWIFLAIRLMIPVSGSALWAEAGRSMGQAALRAEQQAGGPALPGGDGETIPRIVVEVPEAMTMPIAAQSREGSAGITPLDAAAWLWGAGCLGFVLFYLVGYLCYKRRIVREGEPLRDPEILSLADTLAEELGIRKRIPIRVYEGTASPLVIGFVRPVLVLPTERYSERELHFILKHELVHVKRHDVYFKLLLVAARIIHWFNPVIWFMQKEAAVDMELSCDERVVRGAEYDVRRAYTEILLAALHRKCAGNTVLSTQFYEGKRVMKKRFRNILLRVKKKNGLAVLLCAVVLTIGLGTFIGCSVEKSEKPSEGTVADGVAVPDVVLEEARKLAAQWYAGARENNADYNYSNWRIESLEQCYTYEDFDGMTLQLYRMNHQFLSDTPEKIVAAGGMDVTEDGWVTPEYANCRYLVFRQDGESLSFLTVLFENDCFPGDELFDEDLRLQLEELGGRAESKADEKGNLLAVSNGMVKDRVEDSDVVLEEARKLAAQWYADAREYNADYNYSNWRIESLEQCYTYEDFDGMMLQIYRMNHQFLSDTPENVVAAGGMDVTEDGWVTPEYANCRYLVFRQDGESLSLLTVLFENDCFPGDELFDEDLRLQLEELRRSV